jgi:hypothetical protein
MDNPNFLGCIAGLDTLAGEQAVHVAGGEM